MNPRKRNFVIVGLRKLSFKWPTRYEAIRLARVSRGVYRCKKCGVEGKLKDFDVDHVVPVVGKNGFTTFDEYIERLLPDSPSGWQLLCKACHLEKSNKENKRRKKRRKK